MYHLKNSLYISELGALNHYILFDFAEFTLYVALHGVSYLIDFSEQELIRKSEGEGRERRENFVFRTISSQT